MNREHQREFGRRCQTERYPPMGMQDIGAGGRFPLGNPLELAPQSGQGAPPHRLPQQGGNAYPARHRVAYRGTKPHPINRDPIDFTFTGVRGGSDNPDRKTAPHERPREQPEGGAGEFAWPMRKVVGQEDDPHRSVPNVGLFEPGEPASDLAGLLAHSSDHFAEKTESE